MSLAYLYGVGPASAFQGAVGGGAIPAGQLTTGILLAGDAVATVRLWATFEPLAGDISTGWTRPAPVLTWQRAAPVMSWQRAAPITTWQTPATVLEWRAVA